MGSLRDQNEWQLASVFMLRQAGFPMDLLDALEAPDAVGAVHRLRRSEIRLERPRPRCPRVVLRDYQDHATQLQAGWDAFAADYGQTLQAHRAYIASLVHDDVGLREVLLLSNDAQFGQFSRWLDESRAGKQDRRARRVTDLLTMYLQRVTTKNESHAHFGPISVGRFDPAATGLSWTAGELSRYTYFSHWAAEEIGRVFTGRPELARRGSAPPPPTGAAGRQHGAPVRLHRGNRVDRRLELRGTVPAPALSR
jgi:hypothetical protein